MLRGWLRRYTIHRMSCPPQKSRRGFSCKSGSGARRGSSPLLGLWLASTLTLCGEGLRLLPPITQSEGMVRVPIARVDGSLWTQDLAENTALLGMLDLGTPPAQWDVLDGVRTLAGDLLFIDHVSDAGLNTTQYFVARESTPTIVVTVTTAAALRTAVESASPGTRILIASGTYAGGFYFSNVRGEEGRPVVIAAEDPENLPVIQGGSNGMQFSEPAWLEISDLIFTGATENGLNIDDGGTFETPAHQIVLRRLQIRDVGPDGNRDGIKLSGVVDFQIHDCEIERWGTGGSAIDMVGCHRGLIEGNLFRHTSAGVSGGGSGVQSKGGSSDVRIRRNRFENAGARSVNIGGSTGLQFFRPPLVSGEAHAEASEIVVEGNTFVGSTAPIAFVGVDGALVRFNTIYRPERWAIRILQETTEEGFVPCRNGKFTDNIVVFHSTQWSAGGVNVGGGTDPDTFEFARNWWYCLNAPAQSQPTLPVAETAGVYGQSPQFRDELAGDFELEIGSPAEAVGAGALTED